MSRVRRLLHRLRGERGYSLIELITVMGILSIVLGGLTTLFVSSTQAQVDLNERYQAQQNARLALERLRRDVHCASTATVAGSTLTLGLGSHCRSGTGTITWCTVTVSAGRNALYRGTSATCNGTGTKFADYITTSTAFAVTASTSTQLTRVAVDLPVDLKVDNKRAYRLQDALVLRNSTRVTPA